MKKKKWFALGLLASNRVLTAVGQANFTIIGFTSFISKRFDTYDLSVLASSPLFILTSIPRALVTSIAQGSSLMLPRDKTQEEREHRERISQLNHQQSFFYHLVKLPALISTLLSGIGTYKFITVLCERMGLLFHFNFYENPLVADAIIVFSLFSAFCTMSAYMVYTYDQAIKGSAKLLIGEWRKYSKWTWIVTFIHIIGRAVFARYTIHEACKESTSDFLKFVLPNISAIVAIFTDFFSNIHTIHDLNYSLHQSVKKTFFPVFHGDLSSGRKMLCTLTMILGLIDSINYGCGTMMTGTNAFKELLGFDGLFLSLFIFAPVSIFVNYAFNVRKGVEKFIEVSLQDKEETEFIPQLEAEKFFFVPFLPTGPNGSSGHSAVHHHRHSHHPHHTHHHEQKIYSNWALGPFSLSTFSTSTQARIIQGQLQGQHQHGHHKHRRAKSGEVIK